MVGEGFGPGHWSLGREIYFYAPGLKRYETSEFSQRNPQGFVPISVTGGECALQCEHCKGKLLQWMRPAVGKGTLFQLCRRLAESGTEGVLISGGSDARGMVPLLRYADELKRVKEELGLTVLVHTGLVDEALARALEAAGIDGAMLDVIGADETIRDVYHLDAVVADYEQSLALLARYGVPTVPHIVLGLHHGRFLGEEAALRLVAGYPISALVLVVITPMDGTPMEGVSPPGAGDLGRFFERARLLLPDTPVVLGCARPLGETKKAIDRLAVDAGLNGIAYPAEGTVSYAKSKGLTPRFRETCCSLIPS